MTTATAINANLVFFFFQCQMKKSIEKLQQKKSGMKNYNQSYENFLFFFFYKNRMCENAAWVRVSQRSPLRLSTKQNGNDISTVRQARE